MTDPEFFQSIAQLIEYAKQRRQEYLQAANVELFKEWDSSAGALENLLMRRDLKRMSEGLRDG